MKFADGIRFSSLSDFQNIIPDTEIDEYRGRKQRLMFKFYKFFPKVRPAREVSRRTDHLSCCDLAGL